MTGEAYVYMEQVENPVLRQVALERLPNRFFQRPMAIKNSKGEIKIIMKELPQ
jgi:hypothetical protein